MLHIFKNNSTAFSVSCILLFIVCIFFRPPLVAAQTADCALLPGRPVRTLTVSTVYYITDDCQKRPIFNPDVYFSHFSSWSDVSIVDENVLNVIPPHPLNFLPWGSRRQFLSGSLLKTTDDPKVYLKIDNSRYSIESEDVFYSLGFRFTQVEDVVPEVLHALVPQQSISGPSSFPSGMMVKVANEPAVYILEQGSEGIVRRHITQWSSTILYREDHISIISSSALNSFSLADPVVADQPVQDIDLGVLPSGFQIQFPAPPVTRESVTVNSAEAFNAAAATPGTSITVTNSFTGPIQISASDIAVDVAFGASLGELTVNRGVKRVRIQGGEYSRIHIQSPTVYWPTQYTDPDLFVEDVLIDGVRVITPRSGSSFPIIAIEMQGRRIAVVRSETSAWSYSIWSGSPIEYPSEDLIIAFNTFASDGVEATVRLVNADRMAVVENRLTNGTPEQISKHNFRIHGASEDAYVARNQLIYSGTMIGTMDGDSVSRVWFHENTFYQLRPDAFNMDRVRIGWMSVLNNRLYSDMHNCFLCGSVPSGWVLSDNTILPYRSP